MEGCVYILANSCSERRRHLIGPMRTSAADVNLAEARPTPIKERTPTTSTPRRKFVIPAPAVPKTISLRVRERRGFIRVPRSKMAGGFSLDVRRRRWTSCCTQRHTVHRSRAYVSVTVMRPV